MTKPIKDRKGQRFGRLVVVSFDKRENGRTYWKCKCDCGNFTLARADKLVTGGVKSCGCLLEEGRKENLIGFNKPTPGMLGWHFSH